MLGKAVFAVVFYSLFLRQGYIIPSVNIYPKGLKMSHYSVFFENENKEILVHTGKTILEAAEEAGIILDSICGGAGTCGKCIVKIEPGGKDVFACRYVIENDMTVIVPTAKRYFEDRKITEQKDIDLKPLPSVCKYFVEVPPSDISQIRDSLELVSPAGEIIFRNKPEMSIPENFADGITIIFKKDYLSDGQVSSDPKVEILGVESGDTAGLLFGIAVDIGTTTVVAKLFDLNDGRCLATAASANPQISRGDDVISRINYASNEKGLKDLHDVIIKCLNSLIDELCKEAHVSSSNLYEICVAGNTTMNHIFLQLPVKQLGEAPYQAYSLEACDLDAAKMGLHLNPCANVHTIENIAGFVGADTTAAALAAGMDSMEKMSLLVDIGTNGELVIGVKGRLLAASCAAGPALEGARISQGSRAVEGSIEGVAVSDDDISLEVIGGGAGTSICGSGLIDAMAVLLDLGIVDQTGRFADKDDLAGKLSEKILDRIVLSNNQPAFILAANKDNDNKPVMFTQKDIRQTQLAKAAIRAGIIFLQKKMGVADSQIDQILLAGAFGNYIDRKSALRIGLLPSIPIDKVHFVGNAAGTGCQMVLLSTDYRKISAQLVKEIEYIEIANELEFQTVFADALLFA